MAFADIISKIFEMLGLKKSESGNTLAKLAKMEQRFLAVKTAAGDRLEELKKEIRELQHLALEKKNEFDSLKGDLRRIVAGDIERIRKQLSALQEREKLIGRRLEIAAAGLARVQEVRVTIEAGNIDSDDLDELAILLQESIDDMRDTDRAEADLAKIHYEPAIETATDRVSTQPVAESPRTETAAEVTEPAPVVESPEPAPAEEATLSPETDQWLKQLEEE